MHFVKLRIRRCVIACGACVGVPELAHSQQAVSFADLQGATIHTQAFLQQEGLRNGRPFTNQFETAMTITIDSPSSLTNTAIDTARNPEGLRASAPRTGSFTLGKPREVAGSGGGHVLWTFQDGKLILLRTFNSGGMKVTIAFSRSSAEDVKCAIRTVFARETGIEGWHWTSNVSGNDIRVKSIRPISSSCEISKR